MDDTFVCSICGNKLKNISLQNKLLYQTNKISDYIARNCYNGMNHFFQLYFDEKTNNVDYIKISLDPKYSVYVDIDFFNQKTQINCFKYGNPNCIKINKIIEPDFPNLTFLKEKVKTYILFS